MKAFKILLHRPLTVIMLTTVVCMDTISSDESRQAVVLCRIAGHRRNYPFFSLSFRGASKESLYRVLPPSLQLRRTGCSGPLFPQ